MKNSTTQFGEHLTIDGYGGSPTRLTDNKLVLEALNGLPELLGMKKLCEAVVHFAQANYQKDPGKFRSKHFQIGIDCKLI